MAIEEVVGDGDRAGERRGQWIGVYIALLAVLLSIAAMGGNNAAKDAAKANLDATNNWSFFQAKNNRRQQYRFAAENLRIKLAENPSMSGELRSLLEGKLKSYDTKIAKLTSDPDRKEGLDELYHKGKSLEAVRDAALKRDPYFDYGQAFLQIAIVLASVAIVTKLGSALFLSIVIGGIGLFFSANGFLMFAEVL